MTVYLSSFYPLCSTRSGKKASKNFKFPPYIDGSCRREPDFEKQHPSITGLCRPPFAAKLCKGDIVVYTTNKLGIGARKVVAVLEVIHVIQKSNENPKFSTHKKAAKWYFEKKYKLPNNLMVKDNIPHPLVETSRKGRWVDWVGGKSLKEWDKHYLERSINTNVAICKVLCKELNNPIELTENEMLRIFGRRPGTRNPSKVQPKEWDDFRKWLFKNRYNIK